MGKSDPRARDRIIGAKLRAIRVDREHYTEHINDRIVADIRRAQCVVADFTRQRPSVYFEAGFGMALGRPVICTCRDTDFENLHFDIRQFPFIKWRTAAELREQLTMRLRGLGVARRME